MEKTSLGAELPPSLTLLHDAASATLAQALLDAANSCGLKLQVQQADGEQALHLARGVAEQGQLTIYLGAWVDDDTSLKINQIWQRERHPGLFLLQGPRGLEALPALHPRQAPCLKCWDTQLEHFPWLREGDLPAGEAYATEALNAPAVVLAIVSWLQQAGPQMQWNCLRWRGGELQQLQVLRDPLCPHCSSWPERPTQAFYVQTAEAV